MDSHRDGEFRTAKPRRQSWKIWWTGSKGMRRPWLHAARAARGQGRQEGISSAAAYRHNAPAGVHLQVQALRVELFGDHLPWPQDARDLRP